MQSAVLLQTVDFAVAAEVDDDEVVDTQALPLRTCPVLQAEWADQETGGTEKEEVRPGRANGRKPEPTTSWRKRRKI